MDLDRRLSTLNLDHAIPSTSFPPPPAAQQTPVIAAPAPSGDRSALLSAIQGGARLRKAVTNDRSAAPVSGKILGDAAPPPHISATPRAPSPPAPAFQPEPTYSVPDSLPDMASMAPPSSNRESVGWFADLAANQTTPQMEHLPSMTEESEEDHAPVPQIQVEAAHESDPMQDVDFAVG